MGVSGLIACMQLPLNVSPVSASFFGQERLGIHLVLYVACSYLLIICVFSFPLQQRIGSGAWKRSSSASLLLYGKIEEKMIQLFMCKVLVPQHLESGKQPWLLCEKQVLFDLGVRER